MESAERLQHRITTLGELHTIVRTMKTLAATSIRQYEQAVKALADYHRTVDLGLQVVLQETKNWPPEFSRRSEPLRLAAVVFGSDHGLCGRFNEDIATHALEQTGAYAARIEDHRTLVVGARVTDHLEQAGRRVENVLPAPGSAARITDTVQQILLKIDEWRTQSGIRHIHLFYNHHLSRGGYRPTSVELLPVDLHRFQRMNTNPWPSRRLPVYSMDRNSLLTALLRQYFFVSISRACAESQASEHASRLNTMQSAQKNLAERIDEVTMQYRRLRQEAI
ncbi:MAG: F0F1 ATP synthase subunit gamma, partial [Proteobacteria bacterium]